VPSGPIFGRPGDASALLAPASTALDPASAPRAVLAHDPPPRSGDGLLAPPGAWTLAGPRPLRRRLAILAMDVAGYSRLIESDDLRTALRVRAMRRRIVEPAALRHGGRVFSVAGDGMMAAFPAAAQAVACAVAVQRALGASEVDEPAGARLRLRMGVSAGGVLVVEGELYGCALNVAARLEALAEPGGIYVCGAAFDQIGGPVSVWFEPLGELRLDKIRTPCRVYRVARGRLEQG
jgi:adenylate cyclase